MNEQKEENNIKRLITKDIEELKKIPNMEIEEALKELRKYTNEENIKNYRKKLSEKNINKKNVLKDIINITILLNHLIKKYELKFNSKETASIIGYTVELFNNESKQKRKPKKERVPKIKSKEYGSIPTSELSSNLKDEYKSTGIDVSKKEIQTEKKETKSGELSLKKYCEEINPNDINLKESDLLKRYPTIALDREGLQLYFAILNTYITNVKNKNYGKTLEISMKDLHKNILCKNDHLRKTDIEKYRSLLNSIGSRRITFSARNAEIKPYSTRKFKKVCGEIDTYLLIIEIFTDEENTEQSIKVTPSAYTLMELEQIKQVSNFCPNEFLSLDFDRHENIFYFGLYLVRIHNCNHRHKVKGKSICNKTYAWENDLFQIVKKALPNYKFRKLEEDYKETKEKKKYILRNIENPLNEAISIMEKNGYILKTKTKRVEIDYRRAFDTNMIKFIFNYDAAKLLKPVFKQNTEKK
ncbi:MAG: hypothetical protein ABF289_17895 [Clostridiales bacterium]